MSWNRSNGAQKPEPRKPSAMRGIIAGGMIVLAACAAFFFLISGGEKTQAEKAAEKRGLIKAVTPDAAPTNAVPGMPRKKEFPKHRDEFGVLRYESGARAYDPTKTYKEPVIPGSNERRIFRHVSERIIEHLMLAKPGEKLMSAVNYDSKFLQRDFLAALDDKIEIGPDDTERDKMRKQAMIEVKEDLRARLASGEKLGDILNETSKELKRLAAYSDELKKEVKDILKRDDKNLSEKDVKDLVDAANLMLEEKGCNPISVNQMTIWNIRLNAKKAGASREEINAQVGAYKEKVKAQKEQKVK